MPNLLNKRSIIRFLSEEFLPVKESGLPPHEIRLKVGAPGAVRNIFLSTMLALSSHSAVAYRSQVANAPGARGRPVVRAPRSDKVRGIRLSASSSSTATPTVGPVDEGSVLDSVIVGGGISGLTTALVRGHVIRPLSG